MFDPSAPLLLIPSAFEVPSVGSEGGSLGISGFGSFDVPGMSAFSELAIEFSINPIIGHWGDDRVVVCGSLCTQFQKS